LLVVASIYVIAVVLFVTAFVMTGMPKSFAQVMDQARKTTSLLTNPEIDDYAKELAARSASWLMLKTGVVIAVKGAFTLALTLLPFWLADTLEVRSWNETTGFALRWDVLVGTTLAAIGIGFIWRRWITPGRSQTE
jgi:hypothetical protein